MEDLVKLRNEIDAIDDQIVSLFEQRMAVAENVAAFKRSVGKPVLDKEREKIKIQKVTEKTSNAFNRQAVESLFGQIMAVSRMLQYQRLASERTDVEGFRVEDMVTTPKTKVVYTGVPVPMHRRPWTVTLVRKSMALTWRLLEIHGSSPQRTG